MVDATTSFQVICPKGHVVSPKFPTEDLERMLSDGSGKYYCIRCDLIWPMTAEEQVNLRGHIARAENSN